MNYQTLSQTEFTVSRPLVPWIRGRLRETMEFASRLGLGPRFIITVYCGNTPILG